MMQVQEEEPLSESDLQSWGAESTALSKPIGIIRSSTAIISLVSSSLLIWILNRSNARFSSIYHRLLLGMSVGDILLSLSWALFNSAAPSVDDYYVWNARGNQATCSTQGYLYVLGALSGVCYTCSLNLYSLAVIKCNKTDRYIRTKIEPFLHGVPIGWGFIYATTILLGKNMNNGADGNCGYPVYEPPHCIGYADGEIRADYDIPCGRGSDGAVVFVYLGFFITFFAVPIIMGISLCVIYRAVKQQEQVNAKYGASAFAVNTTTQQTSSGANTNEDEGINHRSFSDRISSSIRSTVSYFENRRSSDRSSSTSNSRVVMRRAFAFTASFFLTYSFLFIDICFSIAGKDVPPTIWYLTAIFNPLQGFFNLCIFLQPKVLKIKSRRGNDKNWCQAILEAIWYSGRGDQAPGRGEGRGGGNATRAQQPHHAEGERENGQLKTPQTQRMSLEAQEESQQAPEGDGPHDLHVPLDGNIDQSDAVDP